jgi:hypothetical protein
MRVVEDEVALKLDGGSILRIIILKRPFLDREGIFCRSDDLGGSMDVGISSGRFDAEGRDVQQQIVTRPFLPRPHVVTHEQALTSALSEGPLVLRFLHGMGLVVNQAPERNEMTRERFLVPQFVRRTVRVTNFRSEIVECDVARHRLGPPTVWQPRGKEDTLHAVYNAAYSTFSNTVGLGLVR